LPDASPYSRIAFPRYARHLVCADIHIERAEAPGAAFLALPGYGVMPGRQGDAKSPLIIRGKRGDFRSLVVLYDKSGIRERFRTRSVRPDWPRLSWAKRDDSFDPRSRSGLRLSGRKICSHDQEHQNDCEFSECHHLLLSPDCIRVKTITQVARGVLASSRPTRDAPSRNFFRASCQAAFKPSQRLARAPIAARGGACGPPEWTFACDLRLSPRFNALTLQRFNALVVAQRSQNHLTTRLLR
jgi:hypothetical protein